MEKIKKDINRKKNVGKARLRLGYRGLKLQIEKCTLHFGKQLFVYYRFLV